MSTAIALLMVMALCPAPVVYNETDTWGSNDVAALKRSIQGCKTYYSKMHCLVKFTKKDENRYWAICRKGGYIEVQQPQ